MKSERYQVLLDPTEVKKAEKNIELYGKFNLSDFLRRLIKEYNITAPVYQTFEIPAVPAGNSNLTYIKARRKPTTGVFPVPTNKDLKTKKK